MSEAASVTPDVPPNRTERNPLPRRVLRVLLAGPLALLTSVVTVSASTLWLPAGAAGINHLMLPLMLFPVAWVALFLHACLDRVLWRAYAVEAALLAANAFLILAPPA